MRKYASIIFAFFIITLIFYSIFKFILNINNEGSIKSSNIEVNKNNGYKKINSHKSISESIYWNKKELFIDFDSFKVSNKQADLIIGQKYYLFLTLFNTDKCFYGDFHFLKSEYNQLVFKALNIPNATRFLNYARFINEKIFINIFDERSFNAEKSRQSCKNWVKIKNN
ncbi:hypothetical protein [Fluviispira multicolorata]|uniref:Uncharacterized protein n=1 Tax=Fluviispira multicolorata TaxID=2654512 RepID=A0A833N4H6_9BACT|nr:hypothetical protein [Fluviispira multicolorata]KAB8030831.1 hypothetical protein GCL57_07605 [Fluviispira multicolorata]